MRDTLARATAMRNSNVIYRRAKETEATSDTNRLNNGCLDVHKRRKAHSCPPRVQL